MSSYGKLQRWLQLAAAATLLLLAVVYAETAVAQEHKGHAEVMRRQVVASRLAPAIPPPPPDLPQYVELQHRLSQGWNTWDVQSVATQVLLPDGLAIHVGLEHNTSGLVDSFLNNALIGRLERSAEQVRPGSHAWDGSYTDLKLTWRHSSLRIQSAHDGQDEVILVTPLPDDPRSALPPSVVFSANYLWNRPGTVARKRASMEARDAAHTLAIYCVTAGSEPCGEDKDVNVPVAGPYLAADLVGRVGLSTGKQRTLAEIESVITKARSSYQEGISRAGRSGPIVDAIETTIGWNTIYDPELQRVVTPVSRGWCTGWGGDVLFDWDTFFAASLAAVGDHDLAYANAIEVLRGETPQGFVPNYSRSGGWKSFDRSEPPVGAITVEALYRKYHDRWFLEQTFEPLLRWNRWWAQHRDRQGYLTWGSDGENRPANLDDSWSGTRNGAVLESGLDNSPMYDHVTYDPSTHQLEFADVGLMSLYIADCDALALIAEDLGKTAEAGELRERGRRYRASLATLWDDKIGMFLNKDLSTGQSSLELSPTSFYPLLAKAATPEQARRMIDEHLLNSAEFWGKWVIPSISRNDPAFWEQKYWRGRIWGPMNYLVYLGLRNYDFPQVTSQFARKSLDLFEQEWQANRHVHENYNAITGMSDEVNNSDRFYHWGALLALIEYQQETQPPASVE